MRLRRSKNAPIERAVSLKEESQTQNHNNTATSRLFLFPLYSMRSIEPMASISRNNEKWSAVTYSDCRPF